MERLQLVGQYARYNSVAAVSAARGVRGGKAAIIRDFPRGASGRIRRNVGMSTGFDGVRPASESSIEIGFFYQGRHCVERIRVKPTAANLKRAAERRNAILAAIARGDFDYDAEFPRRAASSRSRKDPT
jgi:hypothetical protein